MADEIIKAPDAKNDPEWLEIVEKLVEEMGDELPDKVIEATELLLCGWTTYQAARKVGTSAKTIKSWLEKYPSMALAVSNGRQFLTKWRMSKLEQQFILAAGKSKEILELDLRDREVQSRLVGVVGQHARFILSMFMGQKVDIEVTVNETPQMKARNDALDYIASQMSALGTKPANVIDASYTVVDPAKEKLPQLLNAKGDPFYGKLGELDINEAGMLCHICGQRTRSVLPHLASHRISTNDYGLVFMIPKDLLKNLPS